MPNLLTIFGLRFFFYSREHEPVHVHVESKEGLAKFEEHFEKEWVRFFKNMEL